MFINTWAGWEEDRQSYREEDPPKGIRPSIYHVEQAAKVYKGEGRHLFFLVSVGEWRPPSSTSYRHHLLPSSKLPSKRFPSLLTLTPSSPPPLLAASLAVSRSRAPAPRYAVFFFFFAFNFDFFGWKLGVSMWYDWENGFFFAWFMLRLKCRRFCVFYWLKYVEKSDLLALFEYVALVLVIACNFCGAGRLPFCQLMPVWWWR